MVRINAIAACLLSCAGAAAAAGPDVVHSDVGGVYNAGAVGAMRGYALGSYTCNIGDVNMRWGTSWQGSPWLAMNAYRLNNGRLEQIGLGFVKNSCCAGAGNGCGTTGSCNNVGGSQLGINCRDIYGASYNGGQSRLSPRSSYNAFTGQEVGADNIASGDAIFKRVQILQSDLDVANFPNALYFVEGVYLASDEGTAGAANNNCSYKRVTVTAGTYAMTETGSMQIGRPAIYAWKDHGLGANVPDPSVTITMVQVPGEGRFYVGSKVVDLGGGLYRYEYAVFNHNSDRSAGAFSVPVAIGTNVDPSLIGFKDVPYHSGEIYDNTDWGRSKNINNVRWSSQAFATPANANALRWGTMYNFWFTADRPPAQAKATIELFKAGTPTCVTVMVPAPMPACIADIATEGNNDPLAGPDGLVTGIDFDNFVESFYILRRRCDGTLISDVTDSYGTGGPDGFATGIDFDLFAERFYKGC